MKLITKIQRTIGDKAINRILSILAIIFITLFVWSSLSELPVRGDGFVYLTENFRRNNWSFPQTFANLNTGSLLLSKIITPIFGTNLSLYLWLVVIVMILINILFYFLVQALTKNTTISLVATLLLIFSYFGHGDMFFGIYAYFTDRVPNMLFIIPSLLLLHLSLEKFSKRNYFLSIFLYLIGIAVWHWSLLFTGVFVIYTVVKKAFERFNLKTIAKGVALALPYLTISLFFSIIQNIYHRGYGQAWTFSGFLLNPQKYHYPELMLRQLTYWSEYWPLFRRLFDRNIINAKNASALLSNPETAKVAEPYIFILYCIVSIIIYKFLPKFRPLLISIILSVASIFYLNLYIASYAVNTQPASNRYLYIPTFLLVIYWSLFLWIILKIPRLGKIFFSIIIFFYLTFNYLLISDNFFQVSEPHLITKKVWSAVVNRRPSMEKGTTVIIPNRHTGSYEAAFLTDQLGRGEVAFFPDEETGWEKAATASAHAIRFDYNKDCKCVIEIKIK